MRRWMIVATVGTIAECVIGGGFVAENLTSYNQLTVRPARGVIEPGRAPSSLTAAAIVGAWGDPDSKDVDGDCEVWRYHRQLAVSAIGRSSPAVSSSTVVDVEYTTAPAPLAGLCARPRR